ncbi:hypothetical protein L226DRAFT_535355 [Lentinus tigrinus ALCF2SS1-7]|uniref:AMP-activated protein kinase glycogen-binding domain-containing protein n=1 Tax=Lentinus tigrinus ALCF2SS1-6 TaxID=1328759 RepID=A0A5C2SFB0_9APHY|nr:hypothetical protein L227DRAFT_573847 [Lentinus tigrinus ALCF2SS1-6]RPD74475.1 hypothetical protein L226DRAFT_535355 [Lentinus tigrinus ALCF2SS1-7]
MSELYEATFRWPHPDASNVIVTGTFDSWSCSHHLAKTPSGSFEGAVKLPWGEKVTYKYIVDGRWTTTDDQATELDPVGNLNNVLRVPARPEPEPVPAPAAAPETETGTEKTMASPEEAPATVGTVNGIVETAKQAAVSMVEALAPGTAETPAETPATEAPPAQTEPVAAPEPSAVDPAAAEITNTAVLPSEPIPVAPEVPVPVLPLSTEQPSDSTSMPVADVSESKPLETLVVEGSTTAETAVVAAPEPSAAEKPSTHEPTAVNGISEEKSATNGVAPADDKAAAVNGTSETPQPTTTPAPESPKPATNGAGKATTPTKEKKMRFPSLSSRHSRGRSSVESGASELGEKEANGNGSGKDSVSSRFASTQRQKRRTSMFGKLKDVFSSHPKKEASSS